MACNTIIVDTKAELEANLKNILQRVSRESIQKRKLFKIGISGIYFNGFFIVMDFYFIL